MPLNQPANCAAIAATLALAACGSGESNMPAGPILADPVFATDAPITAEDFIGTIFPFEYVSIDETTNNLERKTGSIRIVSFDQFEISTDKVTEIVTRTSDGGLVGTTLRSEDFYLSTGLGAILAEDGERVYSGLFGFETPTSQLPDDVVANYTGSDAALLYARGTLFETPQDLLQPVMTGDVDLTVNFGTGAVTGSVFSSEAVRLDMLNAEVFENGITGDLEVFLILGGLPFSFDESSGDVSGRFYEPGASSLAGTFEATAGSVADAPSLDLVGTFGGLKALAGD